MIFILLYFLLPYSSSATCINTFVIERNTVFSGGIIETRPTTGLPECSQNCLNTSECSGFNYLVDGLGGAHCLLIGASDSSNQTDHLLPDTILYAGKLVCLSKACSKRSFAFEKWSERGVRDASNVLETFSNVSRDDCLSHCQIRDWCRSAVYNHNSSVCQLARVSPNTVYNTRTIFNYDEQSDIYENNCIESSVSGSSCTWLRLSSAGLPDVFDSSVHADSADHCQNICAHRVIDGDMCRSFTFDATSSQCLLSISSARLSGKSPIQHSRSNLSHGDLDDCTDFSLKCHADGLEVRGSSMRQFSGFIRTKRDRKVLCARNISSSFEFSARFGFDECGLTKTGTGYMGVVHIKEGSTTLVTIRDKILQVECRVHHQSEMADQSLSVAMNISDTNRTDSVLSDRIIMVPSRAPPRPRYSLTVLSSDAKQAEKVRIGETGWISVVSNKPESTGFSVSKLVAKDSKTGLSKQLIDSEGCVIDKSLIDRIWKVSDREIRMRINFGGFDEEAEVIYHAYVETCLSDCIPKCNSQIVWVDSQKETTTNFPSHASQRNRRAITARSIELSQDVYSVYGSRITLLPVENRYSHKASPTFTKTAHPATQGVHISKAPPPSLGTSMSYCVFDDVTCLFTLLLAAIQLFLLVSCVFIMYCYVQQWRSYRLAESALLPPQRAIIRIAEVKPTTN